MRVVLALLMATTACGRVGFDEGAEHVWSFDSADGLTFLPAEIEIANGTAHLAPIDQRDDDDSATGFGGGTLVTSSWNAGRNALQLDLPATSGGIYSRLFDAGRPVTWGQLTFTTERPSGKPLPEDGSETAYAMGNADTTSLVFLAHMDDTTAVTVRDSGPGHHDGINTNATVNLPGRFGTSIQVNTNAHLDFGNDPSLSPTGPFTTAMWVKRLTTSSSDQFLISKEQNGTIRDEKGFCLYFTADELNFCIGNGGLGMFDELTPAAYTDLTSWYHIVVTHRAGKQVIYVNGTPQVTTNFAFDPTPSINQLVIGQNFNQQSFLHANIDEVAQWNRELSATEVKDLYYRGSTRVSFQVRSCSEPTCTGISYVGPGAMTTPVFTPPESGSTIDLTGIVAPNRYFQYVAYFATDASEVPRLASAAIGPDHRFGGVGTLTLVEGLPLTKLASFRQQLVSTAPADQAAVHFQVSADGITWHYRANNTWAVATDATQASTALEIDAAADSYVAEVGPRLYWRAFLDSPDVELRQIAAVFEP